jgi:preprotein translocase subunit SecA
VQRQEEIAAIEEQDLQKHAAQLEAAMARHGDDEESAALALGPRGAATKQRQAQAAPAPARAAPKIGRNDMCPCGSGKKFKKCHGAAEGPSDEGDDATA